MYNIHSFSYYIKLVNSTVNVSNISHTFWFLRIKYLMYWSRHICSVIAVDVVLNFWLSFLHIILFRVQVYAKLNWSTTTYFIDKNFSTSICPITLLQHSIWISDFLLFVLSKYTILRSFYYKHIINWISIHQHDNVIKKKLLVGYTWILYIKMCLIKFNIG